MKKLLLVFSMVLFAGAMMAQSAKMKERASKKSAEINEYIVSIDKDLALDEEQITKIDEVQLEKLMKIKELKKEKGDTEETKKMIKALHKEYAKKINKEILRKEQRQAMWEAKKADKE